MGFHNITEAGGIGLAVTGMTIVFVALLLVTWFIAGLPRMLPFLDAMLPVAEARHGAPRPSASTGTASAMPDEIIVAIGFALHTSRSEQ
ncbi:MAG: OadG family protein [Planctomycetaceae bacterium]